MQVKLRACNGEATVLKLVDEKYSVRKIKEKQYVGTFKICKYQA